MTTVLDRFFELSDLAGSDLDAFQRLISCFADDASVAMIRGEEIQGKSGIEKYYRELFGNSRKLRHLWVTSGSGNVLKADWAAARQRLDGTLFVFMGENIAELDAQGRIRRLEIRFK